MSQSRNKYQQKKKHSRLYRIFKSIMLLAIVFLVVGGGTLFYLFYRVSDVTSSAQQDLERGDRSEIRETAVNPSKDNISILFLGLDDRDGSLKGRTDANLLATFNKEAGTVKLLSIPRDSRVEIVGRDNQDKINHAHAFGGVDMTIDTVEHLLDIPVDYFVKLNFDAFLEVVDALGGVEIDVPFAFTEMDSTDRQGEITINEGTQILNGEEALAYARMRKKDPRGDIGRGERQQEVLAAIIKKSASFSTITKFDEILESVEKNLVTNLSFGNILSLHSYRSGLNNIESINFEGGDSTIEGIYYYELEDDSVKEVSSALREHLELE